MTFSTDEKFPIETPMEENKKVLTDKSEFGKRDQPIINASSGVLALSKFWCMQQNQPFFIECLSSRLTLSIDNLIEENE